MSYAFEAQHPLLHGLVCTTFFPLSLGLHQSGQSALHAACHVLPAPTLPAQFFIEVANMQTIGSQSGRGHSQRGIPDPYLAGCCSMTRIRRFLHPLLMLGPSC